MNEQKERDHQKFLGYLNDSKAGVVKAACWLNSKGYQVSIPPSSSSLSYEDRMKHVDHGDLFIQQRVEIKVLTVDFTSSEDWPYGKNFIVCAKHSFDNATPKPYMYLIHNNRMTHVAVVMCSTRQHWTVDRRKDRRFEDQNQEYYFCPIDKVLFMES